MSDNKTSDSNLLGRIALGLVLTGVAVAVGAKDEQHDQVLATIDNSSEHVVPERTTYSLQQMKTSEELVAIYRDYVRSSVSYAKYYMEKGRDKAKREAIMLTLSNKGTNDRLQAAISRGASHATLMPLEDANRLAMEDINHILFGSAHPPRC